MNKEIQNIHIDYTNMMAGHVGEKHGVTYAELEDICARATGCLRGLMEERAEGHRPFLDLPYDSKTPSRVLEVARDVVKRAD
ncbi:MAG: hypothetical protein ACYSTQ_08205, partial [Planctomycetota bacterium]